MTDHITIKRGLGISLLVANILLSCIILLAAISTPGYGVAAISAAKANKHLAEENFTEASRLYTEAAEIVKNLESKSGYYASAAHTHLKNGEHVMALNSIINAIETNPVNGSPYQILEWTMRSIPLSHDISNQINQLQQIDKINMDRLEYILSRYLQRTDSKQQAALFSGIQPPLGDALKAWY